MSESTYTLSAIFALFAVTWKITLKTAQNKGSKNWDAKPFLRIIHDIISIFRLHFSKKAGMNGLLPEPGSNTKWPSCTLQTVTLSVKPT